MKVEEVLHMNSGEGKQSYANNSSLQSSLMVKTKPYIEEALLQVFATTKVGKLNVADLGCSSGPNALLAIEMILNVANEIKPPQIGNSHLELHGFMNDLPRNDFNAVFKAIPYFHQKVCERKNGLRQCFISATPGTFYGGGLFPSNSMHFVYTANSLQWLSQVPPELASENAIINKGNIVVGKTSSPAVFNAYLAQSHRDITTFLKSRSKEIVPGGCMVLSVIGRDSLDHSDEEHAIVWSTFADTFHDMTREGLVEEEKVDSFNVPIYQPHAVELREMIQAQGSFEIIRLEAIPISGLDFEEDIRSHIIANTVRAFTEPLLTIQFGEEIMDKLFDEYKDRIPVHGHMGVGIVASLQRKI